jgi:hypothetical protein
MKTKFAIGCLIQWFECDIVGEYIDTLRDAIKAYEGEVEVHFTIVGNEDLEKCTSKEAKEECILKIAKNIGSDIQNPLWKIHVTDELYTIADYRRGFNDLYCDKADVLIWGESDALLPKQMFIVLDSLHQQVKDQTPKYLSFFGTCKMWDKSWESLEHPDFTVKPFVSGPDHTDKWWSTWYTMTKDEMNKINNKTEDLDVKTLNHHKFNGCGLVISSEVIKAGVNIPKSVFFVHEDTAFMHMTNKVLGNIPQYIIKNILLVHNRKHPDKRVHVKGEDTNLPMQVRRETNDWYITAHQMSESNCYNLFNPGYKSFTWKDVFDPKNKDFAFSDAFKKIIKERNK